MSSGTVALERGLELFQQLALALGEADRRFHHDTAQKIARHMAAHGFHALAAQPEQFAGLGFRRHLHLDGAIERRHFDLCAECGLGEAHRQFAIQIIAIALEDRVFAHPHFHVQIAGRRALRPGFAFACEANAISVVHTGGNLHLQRLFVLHHAAPVAIVARVLHLLAAAAAMRAGLLHGEDALLHPYPALAATGGAGFSLAIGGTCAFARLARAQRRHLDGTFDAEHGFFQIQFDHEAQIGTAPRLLLTPTATAEDVSENIPENISEIRRAATRTAAHASLERRVSVLVVHPTLGWIGQHFVGFFALLERLLGGLVAGVAIRMVLHRAAAISLLQIIVTGGLGDAQDFVVVAF